MGKKVLSMENIDDYEQRLFIDTGEDIFGGYGTALHD
jgi:hypothetical protein